MFETVPKERKPDSLLDLLPISWSVLLHCCYYPVRQVVAGFQRLRQEQRSMATKVAELEMEISEHK